ncbi:39S ribosomal protein L49, mitochondrial-like [Uloborus diversus]|uniref:39S ribosomal protein L49, mitochondrial-like n=1 Tax=Uloborus diversus TaxID=327109 RepID=UPI0024092A9F|nr:39S ribosomal protein L49, mitochondrial-like [Uloborus diversus]
MLRQLLTFSNIKFVQKCPKFRQKATRPPVIDNSEVYRAKVIPQDIWIENKDPKFTDVEEVKDHWHFVERLFPPLRIPEPIKKTSSTGWRAPSETVPNLPYFVERTRNHMLPVYERHISVYEILVTRVRRVHGDIWVFEHDLKSYLEERLGEEVESNVNEISCYVNFRGRHSELIKEWLYNKGF